MNKILYFISMLNLEVIVFGEVVFFEVIEF